MERSRTLTESSRATADITAPPAEDRLMTVGEVAAFLQVAEIFVYRHAKEMGAFKVGSHVRFRKTRVDEWLDSRVLDSAPSECRTDVDNELMDRLAVRVRRRGRA